MADGLQSGGGSNLPSESDFNSFMQQFIQSQSQASSGPRPYFGQSYNRTNHLNRGDGRRAQGASPSGDGRVDWNVHLDDFIAKWNADAAWRTQLISLGIKTGMMAQSNNGPSDYYNLWLKAGQLSSDWADAGKKYTPMDVLKFLAGSTGSGPDGVRQTNRSSGTSVSYNLSDAATARALTDHVFEAALGRKATAQELMAYKAALNSYEHANPTVSSHSSTTTYDASGNSTTSESASQRNAGATGEGRAQVLKDKADATPEAQAYQTSSLFDEAMKYLGGH